MTSNSCARGNIDKLSQVSHRFRVNYEFRIFHARHNITVFLALDCEKMTAYAKEERHIKEENIRLQRKLQREMERREALSRQLSESESSLEMDDER